MQGQTHALGRCCKPLHARHAVRAADKTLTYCRWRDSCQKYHPTWKHMFWDNAAAEQLLEEKYPWFLDTWRMYPRVVHRGEARRALRVCEGHNKAYTFWTSHQSTARRAVNAAMLPQAPQGNALFGICQGAIQGRHLIGTRWHCSC